MGKLILALAVAYVGLVSLSILVAGALTPGYSHAAQFISELGATGAPQETFVRWVYFTPAGMLLPLFCLLAYRQVPPSRLTAVGFTGIAVFGAGYVVTALFPCDPGCQPANPSAAQLIHNAAAMVSYLPAPGMLMILAHRSSQWPRAGMLPVIGWSMAFLALAGLLTLTPESPFVGISQRLLEGAVATWVLACGLYVWKRTNNGRSRDEASA